MILSYVVSCAFFLCLVQANLELLFDDAFCNVYNTEYIDPDCTVEIMEDSEYGNNLNVHIVINKKVDSIVASAKLLGMERTGEYTQDVGLSVTMDICESLAGPPNLANVFVKALDLKPGECPPEPGVYGKEHFIIETGGSSGLPDSFPGGKYYLNMTILSDIVKLLGMDIYFTGMVGPTGWADHAIYRDTNIYPKPAPLDPWRFSNEDLGVSKSGVPSSWFGNDSRNCIGNAVKNVLLQPGMPSHCGAIEQTVSRTTELVN